ncbi:MAG: GAF domain-containing protein [Burkholderiales bacterium]|nr:GAF domain-containing protein [Burkholderiales bacterium]
MGRDRGGRAIAKAGKRGRKAAPQARQAALAPRQDSAERLELVTHAINEGVYDWDLARNTIYYSERVYAALGMSPNLVRTPKDWRRRIHPDDLGEYDRRLVEHFKGRRERFECDYRYRDRHGAWRWARQHGIAVRDAGGRVLRMVGSTGDITEMKRVERALKESQDRYALATQAATEGIYEWNLGSGSLFLSERAKEFFAVRGKALTPAAWNRRVHKDDFPGYRAALTAFLKDREAKYFEHEYRIRDAAGGYAWILDRAVAERGARDRVLRMVGALSDVTERKQHELQLSRARDEATAALERQTATAEILKVIASSPSDVQPVFDVIVRNAVRLCGARYGRAYRYDGALIQMVAGHGLSKDGRVLVQHVFPRPAGKDTIVGRVMLSRMPMFVRDSERDRAVPALSRKMIRALETRSQVTVPMLRGGEPIGAITLGWSEPGAFNDQQVALLRTFADQAAIAIENVRLFNETKEALEQQRASAEVLGAISGSMSNTQPVFDRILESCERLFAGRLIGINVLGADGRLHLGAYRGEGRERFEKVFPLPADEGSGSGLAMLRGQVVHFPDVDADASIPPPTRDGCAALGVKSVIFAPMMAEEGAIGAIFVGRRHAVPFSDKEIELLKGFANQAAISIKNVRLFNETREALERQTATAEILKVIASSPSDVQPVFDAIACAAQKLLHARNAVIVRVADDTLHLVAHTETTEAGDAALRKLFPTRLTGQGAAGKAVVSGMPNWIVDVETDPAYSAEFRAGARARGYRSLLVVPMMREDKAIGAINVTRPEPGEFSEQQIKLLQSFADQAVIAIENVRLFNETKEALERQTATAEILRVISQSTTDVQPVLEAIVVSAAKLFPRCNAFVFMRDGNLVRLRAIEGTTVDARLREELGGVYPVPFDPAVSSSARAMVERQPNFCADTEGPDVPEHIRSAGRAARFRSNVVVPLVRDDEGIGSIVLTDPRPGYVLDDKQLALLRTFADQAVIAIENVRLFNETKEALEQQTATAEILRVISESPTDTQPVFEAIVKSGLRLYPDSVVMLGIPIGGKVRAAAIAAAEDGAVQAMSGRFPVPLLPDRMHAAAILQGELIDVPDADAAAAGPYAAGVKNFLASGYRAITIAPMICGDAAIGAISVSRPRPGPLSDKQIALLRTFAAQAVIAIENVRLFKELEARTEALTRSVGQLTALREVGQAVSSTLDLETVLRSIAARAVQLTGLDSATIYEYDERTEAFHLRTAENLSDEIVAMLRETPMAKGAGPVGRAVETGEPVEIAEMLDDSYQSPRRDFLLKAGYRALLVVPLLRESQIIGALTVSRRSPGAFAPEIVDLLKTFATQSAVAIQNARLFREIAEKGKQLEVASRHKSQFLASMSHELRTPLNAILGFNEMILDQVYGELSADVRAPLENIQTSGKHLLRLINNVLDLAKIEAGRMELALADYLVQDTVASVHATLKPLAAEKGLEFLASVPEDLPPAYGDGGRIAQCLMNLAGNSLKFTKQGRVEIAVAQADGQLRYSVTDTGIGIAPDKIGSLFTEFKQTDATIASEYGGTGLGLSITRKFIEMHGGRIWVESEPGKGSAFIFEVPLRAKA